jgi:transcriptional regulator with XRE-family HTH domain
MILHQIIVCLIEVSMTVQEGSPKPEQSRSRQAALLTATLKRLFQARGLRYRDVAKTIGVSEITVKRWMSMADLTIGQTELLCDVAGVSFTELCELATKDYDARLRQLTMEQEEGLAQDGLLTLIFSLLLSGWTASELRRECEIDEATLVSYLMRLDRLRLIDLLPGNFVRLLVKRDFEWRRTGPVRSLFYTNVKQYFLALDFRTPDAIWGSDLLRISSRSVPRIEQMFKEFDLSLRALAEADRAQEGGQKHWYITLTAAHPVTFEFPKMETRRGKSG